MNSKENQNRIWKFGKIGGGTVRQVNHPYFKCHVAMNGAEPTKDNGVFLLSNAISTTNALCSQRTLFSSLSGGPPSVPEGAGGSFQVWTFLEYPPRNCCHCLGFVAPLPSTYFRYLVRAHFAGAGCVTRRSRNPSWRRSARTTSAPSVSAST